MSRARRPDVKPTIGLVVEGDTEYEALPFLHTRRLIAGCPPLSALNVGGVGSHLNPTGVAKRVAPQVRIHVAAGRTKVIVCIDREQRDGCVGAFAQSVAAALKTELASKPALPPHEVLVVLADRTFEAWLLADAAGLHQRGAFKKQPPKAFRFEGSQKKGTAELARFLDRDYRKTTDGPALFAKLDFAAARRWRANARGSRSLDKLLRTLGV